LSGSKAFILHLERASSRAATVQSLRAGMAIESEVLGAIDGARLTPQEVDQAYARRRFRPNYPFPLTRTEVGVFLSHRLAWRRIVDDGLDFAFIFEDDAEIDPSQFAALVEFVILERRAWDYVLMPAQPIRNGAVVASRCGLTLLRPDAPPLRAIAQIVSLAAAKRLLDRLALANPGRVPPDRRQHRPAQIDGPPRAPPPRSDAPDLSGAGARPLPAAFGGRFALV
jgi:glycosyl transferase, family 25